LGLGPGAEEPEVVHVHPLVLVDEEESAFEVHHQAREAVLPVAGEHPRQQHPAVAAAHQHGGVLARERHDHGHLAFGNGQLEQLVAQHRWRGDHRGEVTPRALGAGQQFLQQQLREEVQQVLRRTFLRAFGRGDTPNGLAGEEPLLLGLAVDHLVQHAPLDRRHLDQQVHQVLVDQHQRHGRAGVPGGGDGLLQQLRKPVRALDRLGRFPDAGDLAALHGHGAELLAQPGHAQRVVMAGQAAAGGGAASAEGEHGAGGTYLALAFLLQ